MSLDSTKPTFSLRSTAHPLAIKEPRASGSSPIEETTIEEDIEAKEITIEEDITSRLQRVSQIYLSGKDV